MLDESFPAERWGEGLEGQEPEFAPVQEAKDEGEDEGTGEDEGEGAAASHVDANKEFVAKIKAMDMRIETWWESMPGEERELEFNPS